MLLLPEWAVWAFKQNIISMKNEVRKRASFFLRLEFNRVITKFFLVLDKKRKKFLLMSIRFYFYRFFMDKVYVVLFGRPGSGKGFLGDCIKQEIVRQNVLSASQMVYLSTGDLLRTEIALGSPLGLKIKEIVNSGGLVSDEIVNELFAKACRCDATLVFVDGYPRTREQYDVFIASVKAEGGVVIPINRDTPPKLILERAKERRVCKNCKATHSVKDGCCPKCGGESLVRADDAVIDKRIAEFERNTAGLWFEFCMDSDFAETVDGTIEAKYIAKQFVRDYAVLFQ